jgi:glycine cleavage system H protein
MEPAKLRYAETHEWSGMEGELVVVGITKYAVDLLTDIVFISLPDKGDHTFKGDSFGEIESVKAVSDLYAPVDGEIVAVNDDLREEPETIAADPYGKGWLIKIRPEPGQNIDHLMTKADYDKKVASEAH